MPTAQEEKLAKVLTAAARKPEGASVEIQQIPVGVKDINLLESLPDARADISQVADYKSANPLSQPGQKYSIGDFTSKNSATETTPEKPTESSYRFSDFLSSIGNIVKSLGADKVETNPLTGVPYTQKEQADAFVKRNVIASTKDGDTLYQVLTNPEFNNLPADQQIKILAYQFPEGGFSGLTPNQYSQYRTHEAMIPLSSAVEPPQASLKDRVIDEVRPFIQDLGTVGGAKYGAQLGGEVGGFPGMAVGATAGGLLGAFGPDFVAQYVKSQEEPSVASDLLNLGPGSVSSRLVNSAQQLALMRGGDKIIKFAPVIRDIDKRFSDSVGRGVEKVWGFMRGGPTEWPLLDAAKATGSMYKSQTYGDNNASRLIENFMFPAARARAQESVQSGVMKDLEDLGGNSTLNELSKMAQADVKSGYAEAGTMADKLITPAALKAKANVARTFAYDLGSTGKNVAQRELENGRSIEGPVNTSFTADTFQRLAANNKVDPVIQKMAQDFLTATGNGTHELSFEEMWKLYRIMDTNGFSGIMKESQITPLVKSFRELRNAIEYDINKGISNWRGKSKVAIDSFNEARAVLDDSHDTFMRRGKSANLVNLAEDSLTPNKHIDKIMASPSEIEHAINTSAIKRETLQSYQVQQWVSDASTKDATGKVAVNPVGLQNSIKEAEQAGIAKALWPKQESLDALKSSLIQLSKARGGDTTFSPRGINFWKGAAGVGIGDMILSKYISMGALHNILSVPVGVGLSYGAWTTLMNRPGMAQRMANFTAGRPLGISKDMFARSLMSALEGTRLNIVHQDKSEIPVVVKDGDLIPVK